MPPPTPTTPARPVHVHVDQPDGGDTSTQRQQLATTVGTPSGGLNGAPTPGQSRRGSAASGALPRVSVLRVAGESASAAREDDRDADPAPDASPAASPSGGAWDDMGGSPTSDRLVAAIRAVAALEDHPAAGSSVEEDEEEEEEEAEEDDTFEPAPTHRQDQPTPDHTHHQHAHGHLAESASGELSVAHRLSLRILGSAAERAKQRTREEKDLPLQRWLEHCSDVSATSVLATLSTSPAGLPPAAIEPRLHVFGRNQLVTAKPPTWYAQLAECFLHPFNVLLSVLAIVAAATGDMGSLILLLTIVTISVTIAFIQDRRALISALALSKRITQMVRVRRMRPAPPPAAASSTPLAPWSPTGSGVELVVRVVSDVEAVSVSNTSCVDLDSASEDEVLASSPAAHARLSSRAPHRPSSRSGKYKRSPVHRSYTVQEVPSQEVVLGDIVLLSAGSLVPADLRLLECEQMLINQTILTGESIPSEKKSTKYSIRPSGSGDDATLPADSHYLRRPNLAMMGSVVESGSGVGIVIATGSNSYFGQNARELQQARPPSAFALGVKQVSYILMGFTLVMMPVVVLINGLLKRDWTEAALFGAAVAVGITPAMLPMIVSGNLTLAAHKLAGKKCLVKRLEAIQNLGAATVLATDKTGTLTNDHVELNSALTTDGTAAVVLSADDSLAGDLRPIRSLQVGFLIAALQNGFRNVLDRAIMEYGAHTAEGKHASDHDEKMHVDGGVQPTSGSTPRVCFPSSDTFDLVMEIPFDFRRRRMSVIVDVHARHSARSTAASGEGTPATNTVELVPPHLRQATSSAHSSDESPSARYLYCKGALAETIRVCTRYLPSDASSTSLPLDDSVRAQIHLLGENLAKRGLRVLAVGEKQLSDDEVALTSSAQVNATQALRCESELTFVGLLTFLDAPKESAAAALKDLATMNVRTKVLTGDSPFVAVFVCEKLGLDIGDCVLTGDDLARLTWNDEDPELLELFRRTILFSQLSPDDKARVVRVLRLGGETVAFMGDGLNDALAMRESDVGISVDSGADLAKESADIILTDKDLGVLVTAVRTGRRTHGNTIKYIKMAASSNFGNCFSLLVAAGWLPFLPAGSLQILTQGLLYDISQLAIPFDRMDDSWLKYPQPWSGANLISFMACIGPISSVFDITTFAISYYLYGWDNADDTEGVKRFQTSWFMVGLSTQVLIVHFIRTEKIPFLQSNAHPRVTAMSLIILAIGLALPYIQPIADVLEMSPPPVSFFGVIAATVAAYALLLLAVKKIYIRVFKQWL